MEFFFKNKIWKIFLLQKNIVVGPTFQKCTAQYIAKTFGIHVYNYRKKNKPCHIWSSPNVKVLAPKDDDIKTGTKQTRLHPNL